MTEVNKITQVLSLNDQGDNVSGNNNLFGKNDSLSVLDGINESSLFQVNSVLSNSLRQKVKFEVG